MRVRTALAGSLALAVVVSGCAAGTVAGTPGPFRTPAPLTAPATQIVFQVESGGGYAPPDYLANLRPSLTVYGNGDAFVVDQQATSLSAARPLAFRRGHVPIDDLADLVRDAGRSGLFDDGTDFGEPSITDSGTTSVTLRPGRATAERAAAYALSWTEGDSSLSLSQRSNRGALRGLLHRLFDSVREPADWTPRDVQVSEASQHDAGRAIEWPGPSLATLLIGRSDVGRPCGVVSGTAARRIYLLAHTSGTGRWRDGATEKNLVISALLPGELGCRR